MGIALVLLAPLAGAGGWLVSDRLESHNDFCNAGHLPDGTPLHRQIREDFDRLVPVNLGGVHGRGLLDRREHDPAFRCMDCHAGAGALGRTRVKLLAAKDALRYVAGRFAEPEGMPWPLSPALCRTCHERLRRAAAPGWSRESFHAVPAHAGASGVRCVDCHVVHQSGGDAFAYFLQRERVRAQCLRCHEELPAASDG